MVSVNGEALDQDSFLDANDDFEAAGDAIVRILAFNTIQNEWSTIPFGDDPINSDNVDTDGITTIAGDVDEDDKIGDTLDDLDIPFGDAVWVFATEAATLVPGGNVLD